MSGRSDDRHCDTCQCDGARGVWVPRPLLALLVDAYSLQVSDVAPAVMFCESPDPWGGTSIRTYRIDSVHIVADVAAELLRGGIERVQVEACPVGHPDATGELVDPAVFHGWEWLES